jgi:chromosome segregation ATPase
MALSNIDLVLVAATGLSWLVAGGVAQRSRPVRTDEDAGTSAPAAEQPLEQISEPDSKLQDRLTQLQAEADGARNSAEELKQQLLAKSVEADEARAEAELILLQLHQVQEELEHYFLLSRDLQGQLEQRGSQQPAPVGQIKALHQRFGEVIQRQQSRQSRLEALVLQQNSALSRASRLLQRRTPAKAAVPPFASQVHEEIAFL